MKRVCNRQMKRLLGISLKLLPKRIKMRSKNNKIRKVSKVSKASKAKRAIRNRMRQRRKPQINRRKTKSMISLRLLRMLDSSQRLHNKLSKFPNSELKRRMWKKTRNRMERNKKIKKAIMLRNKSNRLMKKLMILHQLFETVRKARIASIEITKSKSLSKMNNIKNRSRTLRMWRISQQTLSKQSFHHRKLILKMVINWAQLKR